MPNRIVREGILDSDAVNELSWGGEVFYRRLMQVADDYGRFDAREEILRSKMYPLKLDIVSKTDVGKWLTECVTAGLVSCYTVSGKKYLLILNFNQQVRLKKEKYPAPVTRIADDKQMHSICMLESNPIQSESEVEVELQKNQFPDFKNCTALLSSSDYDVIIQTYKIRKGVLLSTERVNELYTAFKMQNLNGKKFYQDNDEVIKHFKNWMPLQKIEHKTEPVKEESREATIKHAQNLAARYS